MNDHESICPANPQEWRDWLQANHRDKQAVWLVYHKVSSPAHNLTWSEAVDEALCFGWIDGRRRSIDEERFMQYFCPRKPQSMWSKINKDKVEALEKAGKMAPAGWKVIEVAKQNGTWTLMDEVEALVLPADLEVGLKAHEGALEFYQGLSDSKKKGLLAWLVMAKRPETREKRLQEIVASAAKGRMPTRFG